MNIETNYEKYVRKLNEFNLNSDGKKILLSEKDYLLVLETLETPPVPSQFLIDAFNEYEKFINEKYNK